MVLDAVGITLVVTVAAWTVFAGLRDGRISYGHVSSRFLYADRNAQPRFFWTVIAVATAAGVAGVIGLADLAMMLLATSFT